MALTPEQIEARKRGIGGSEVAALVGEHPFLAPIDVWRVRHDPSYKVEDNEDMRRGRLFERPTAEWWRELRQATIESPGTILSKRHPVVIATPDFLGHPEGEDVLDLSIKVPRRADNWGPSGTDEVPAYALLQVQWEMLALSDRGIARAEIAAPIYGDLRIYSVTAEFELQSMLLEAAEKFWTDHIKSGRPPEPDYSDSYAAWLKDRYPIDKSPVVVATDNQAAIAWAYKNARMKREQAEKEEAEARNALIAAIGEASGLKGNGWSISYKSTKGRATTDWKAVAAEARVPSDVIEKHTKRNPYRVFRPKFEGMEADE